MHLNIVRQLLPEPMARGTGICKAQKWSKRMRLSCGFRVRADWWQFEMTTIVRFPVLPKRGPSSPPQPPIASTTTIVTTAPVSVEDDKADDIDTNKSNNSNK